MTDYLSVRDLNTSERKVELMITRAFAAMELKLDIIQTSETQSNYYKIYNIFKSNVGSALHLVGFLSRK